MPTLPLFTPPTNPDASHRVISPGGYESWRWDLESDGLRALIEFHLGEPMSRSYARQVARFTSAPTRVSPPMPAEFPAVSVEIFENDRLELREIDRRSEFFSADDAVQVRVGGSEFQTAGDGTVMLSLATPTVTADLVLRPLVRASRRIDVSPHHAWLLCDPLHAIEGEIRWRSRDGAQQSRKIRGRAYHDHHIGLRPLAAISPTIFDGRILLSDGVRAFFQSGQDRLRTIEFADGQITESEESLAVNGSERTGWELSYPLDLPGARVIDSTFCSAMILYDVDLKSGRTAFCRVRAPRRARWAIKC